MKWNLLGVAGLLTVVVALAHLGCIVFGAEWYRFFGAGEGMASLAEQGHPYPTIVTSVIVGIITIWSVYAFSGAGWIMRMPLLRTGLILIAAVLITRSVAFYFIMPMFPENSITFWLVSSSICFGLGSLYACGLIQSWSSLKVNVKKDK